MLTTSLLFHIMDGPSLLTSFMLRQSGDASLFTISLVFERAEVLPRSLLFNRVIDLDKYKDLV